MSLRTLPQMALGKWRGINEMEVLVSFREGIEAVVSAKYSKHPSVHISRATTLSLVGFTAIETATSNTASEAASFAAMAAAEVANGSISKVASAAASAAQSASLSQSLSRTTSDLGVAVSHDANLFENLNQSQFILEHRLWGNAKSVEMETVWSGLRTQLLDRDEKWSFWVKWYESFLDGSPIDWELQEEIASIPETEWLSGSSHIANLIELITSRHHLREQVEVLKNLLRSDLSAYAHRGHNSPPELLETDQEPFSLLNGIEATLKTLEVEITKPNPSHEILGKVLVGLSSGLISVGKYAVKLLDIAAQEAAKEVGSTGVKWVIGAGIAYFAIQTTPIQAALSAVIESLKVFSKLVH